MDLSVTALVRVGFFGWGRRSLLVPVGSELYSTHTEGEIVVVIFYIRHHTFIPTFGGTLWEFWAGKGLGLFLLVQRYIQVDGRIVIHFALLLGYHTRPLLLTHLKVALWVCYRPCCSWWTLKCLRSILVKLFSTLVWRFLACTFIVSSSQRPVPRSAFFIPHMRPRVPTTTGKFVTVKCGPWCARSAANSRYFDLFWAATTLIVSSNSFFPSAYTFRSSTNITWVSGWIW